MEQVYLPGKIRDRIQDLMKSRKITQAELAAMLGVSQGAVSQWETDVSTPSVQSVIEMSSIFGCTTDDILINGKEASENA